jgi:PhoPQ-activated pathogenicity-related protein
VQRRAGSPISIVLGGPAGRILNYEVGFFTEQKFFGQTRIERIDGMKWTRSIVFVVAALRLTAPVRADLASYLARPEPTYSWEQKALTTSAGGSVQDLSIVSQTWQDGPWTHRIQVFRSVKPAHPEFCLLYNTGGSGGIGDAAMGMMLANGTGCTVAILYNIPNQPLYGKSEDALIVYTWQKYIETRDETWPLQFPMAKAVIKAMDAVQASAVSAKQPAVSKFLITGASKRGWTAWLAAASGDKRIAAIAPMVIDMLNMPKQIPHQMEMYGKPSEAINDYTSGGMLNMLDTAPGKRIVSMVDPYSLRAKLALPKLLVLGTNDQYWSQDALNLYWDDLPGPKWVLYTPNSTHGLEDKARVLATVSAFTRSVAEGKAWPKPSWRWAGDATGATLTVLTDRPLQSARLFRVESSTRDFRKSKWASTPITPGKTTLSAHATAPTAGYAATFAELTYETEGAPFTLSTQIRILETKP